VCIYRIINENKIKEFKNRILRKNIDNVIFFDLIRKRFEKKINTNEGGLHTHIFERSQFKTDKLQVINTYRRMASRNKDV